MKSMLLTLFEYNRWAYRRTWGCARALTPAQFVEDLPYSQGSIRNQLVHVLSAADRWVARLTGAPQPERVEPAHFAVLDDLIPAWDAVDQRQIAAVQSLSQAELEAPFEWSLEIRGLRQTNTRAEIFLHLANHATDHRVQILQTLNQHFGVTTFEQDLLFYLVDQKQA